MVTVKASPHPLPIPTKQDLAQYLGLQTRELNYWFYGLRPSNRYKVFELRRRSGGIRTIHAPIKPIKEIQRRLVELLAALYSPPPYVHGYVTDRSFITNANVHKGQRWVLRIDLKDFFPTIHFGRVRGMFMASPFDYQPEVATLLAQICCHQNQIPHGAPTSPFVSNVICRGLDRRIAQLAARERCYYSRYCDDLIFSTRRQRFPSSLAGPDSGSGRIVVGDELRQLIEDQGFEINNEKTSLRNPTQRQMVTGLITNEFPNIPRRYIRTVRNVPYIWKKYGEEAAESRFRRADAINRPPEKPLPSISAVIRGQIQHVGAVKGWQSPVYRRLAGHLSVLDNSFRPTDRIAPWPAMTFQVFCEGSSDSTHLHTALKHLHGEGLFPEIELVFNKEGLKGDDALLKRCQTASHVEHKIPQIYIVDRDSPKVIKKASTGGSFREWGNRVFSFALPHPTHRQPEEPLCIELLYEDSVLDLTDRHGRRVYRRSEFDARGQHRTEPVRCNRAERTSLIPGEVIHLESRANVALGKVAFAESVAKRRPPFEAVGFHGFQPTFEMLTAIRRHVLLNHNE